MQQIKDEVRQAIARRTRERILKRLEARETARRDDGHLPVEQRRFHGKCLGRSGNLGEPRGPIVVATAFQPHLAAADQAPIR
jgi:hypothetical protein